MIATVINVMAVQEGISRALREIAGQEDTLSRMDNVVNSMEGVWESDAQKEYAESFRRTKQNITGFNTNMKQTLQKLGGFVSECVNVDNQTARELRSVNW